jgi:phosphatidylserine/phosphatidylglycerophosphate/cardiolipin synthase-like enzyme
MRLTSRLLLVAVAALFTGCAASPPADAPAGASAPRAFVEEVSATSVLGPDSKFVGSPYADVGSSGLFPPHGPADCRLAVLANGEDSLAVRLEVLKAAQKSIRIQALVFKGDESGLRVAEILKQKKAAGLDVRIIVDGEAAAAVAITGGLNIGNEYFRANPADPDSTWRDQDVVVRGAIVQDLVTAFDRNFDYFVGVKKSRGVFNTNLYWEATRHVLDKTGKVPVQFTTNPDVVAHVAEIEARQPMLEYAGATCRFFQSRPRLKESYIQHAYVKLIERARSEVLIANAYFVPTASIKLALQDAAKRCVAVRLISNSPATNDLPEISLVGRGHYKDLLAVNETPEVAACNSADKGLRIWEWVGQSAAEAERRQGTMHSKYAVIDGRRSLVGSYNLDPRSEKLNSESAMVFEQPELSGRLRDAFFDNDLSYSREVTAAQAAEFEAPEDVVERFRKSIGHLFEQHL